MALGWRSYRLDGTHLQTPRPFNVIHYANAAAGDDMESLTLLCDPRNRMKSNKLTLHDLRRARVE